MSTILVLIVAPLVIYKIIIWIRTPAVNTDLEINGASKKNKKKKMDRSAVTDARMKQVTPGSYVAIDRASIEEAMCICKLEKEISNTEHNIRDQKKSLGAPVDPGTKGVYRRKLVDFDETLRRQKSQLDELKRRAVDAGLYGKSMEELKHMLL